MFTSRSGNTGSLGLRSAAFAALALLAACGGGDGPDWRPAPVPPTPPQADRGPLYDFTPIGLPGSTHGDIVRQGIQNGGLVAGTTWDAAGNTRAFLFNGKQTIDLGNFGGAGARAFSVNRCGQVSGWARGPGEVARAFSYNGSLRDLGTLGGADSYGNVIGVCGRVAGWAATASGQWHAFYHNGSTMRDLGTFGGANSFAVALNSAGQVVGHAFGPGNAWYRAFLYDARTGAPIQEIGPSGVNSAAQDINEAGQVAGTSRDAEGILRAFRYSKGTLQDLGLLPGAQGAEARAINAAGHVVGYVYFPDKRQVAFLHDGTTLRELGALGGSRFSDAVAINAAGLVVGSSIAPQSNTEHAMAWTGSYGMVDLNERVPDLPKGIELVAALAVADDGAIAVRTNQGLGLLRPRK